MDDLNISGRKECIYCGSKVWKLGSNRRLGNEHIIPEGLGGRLILKQAACESCEKITSKNELEWLRGPFYAARVQRGFGKKKNRKQRFIALKIKTNGVESVVNVPIEQYPALIVTLNFNEPAALTGNLDTYPPLSGGIAIGNSPQFGKFLGAYYPGSDVVIESPIKATANQLGCMLAKIAHSYLVAQLGLHRFTPLLNDIITLKDLSLLTKWVGSAKVLPKKIDKVHDLQIERAVMHDNTPVHIVKVRLFSDLDGMPEYVIVAGKVKSVADAALQADVLEPLTRPSNP